MKNLFKTKLILVFFILLLGCASQKYFNGRIENRNLTWIDFVGIPDENSKFDAYTFWYVKYKYDPPNFNSGFSTKIKFKVWKELSNKSWVKEYANTDMDLLNHEQGHYDIATLCEIELRNTFKNKIFLKSDYEFQIDVIFNQVLQKYVQMGKNYDLETNHMSHVENQKKWDIFFAEQLKKSI